MGIEDITIERFTCDRCPKSEDLVSGKDLERRAKWGQLQSQGLQGSITMGIHGYKMILCPDCVRSLKIWSEYHRDQPGTEGVRGSHGGETGHG